jgi:membrane fusion protein (multidrug efflux system)
VFVVEVDTTPEPAKKPEEDKPAKKGEAKASEPAKPKGPRYVAKRKPVVVGYTAGDAIEVREGLSEGDRVITVGRAAVRDGTKVQIVEGAK